MYLRKYEIIVIINPEADEARIAKATERMAEALEKTGGQSIRTEAWGVRRLAYDLGGHRRGLYHYETFLGSNETVAEMERLLGITESVLKYQTILLQDRIVADTFDFEAAKAERTGLVPSQPQVQAPAPAPAPETQQEVA